MSPNLRDLPLHSSYSQLDTWLTCGEKYWLQKGTDIRQLPSWALLGGSAVHSATEEMDFALYREGVDFDPSQAEGLFAAHLQRHIDRATRENGCTEGEIQRSGRESKAWPNKEDKSWWLHHGPAMLLAWKRWQEVTPWELWFAPDGQPAIELELEATFGGGTLKMAIDRVYVAWGQLCVVDIKSGRTPISQLQLGLYAAALEQKYGVKVTYGSYWMSRTGDSTPPASLSGYTPERLDATFRKFSAAKEAGIFLPHPSNLCGSCGVRDFCTARGSRADEIPRPYLEA